MATHAELKAEALSNPNIRKLYEEYEEENTILDVWNAQIKKDKEIAKSKGPIKGPLVLEKHMLQAY